MSRDSKFKWSVIGFTAALNVVLILGLDLGFDLRSLGWPAAFTAVLSVVGLYYRRRREMHFVLCLNALLHLVLFSASFAVLMYCGATFARPLIDDHLVRWDALLGCHLPDLLAWVGAYPVLDRVLRFSYDTLLPQTALVVGLLGLLGRQRPLEVFMQRLMVSAWLTVLVFFLFPAAGPFEAFEYPPNPTQQHYLNHFTALRSGDMQQLSLEGAEGLITFPSFHTTWAMLMALAFWRLRVVFVLSAVWNSAVIFSTMTTGWHYLSDVIAGVGVGVAAMLLCRQLGRWIYIAPASDVAT